MDEGEEAGHCCDHVKPVSTCDHQANCDEDQRPSEASQQPINEYWGGLGGLGGLGGVWG